MTKKEFQIGEIFQYGLVKMLCKKADATRLCYDCDFYDLHNECCIGDYVGECSGRNREDKTDVIFVKVEG
jgi:hypothetical protein